MLEYNTVLSTLKAHIPDGNAVKKLTETEMLLMLMERLAPSANPYKAYLLVCNYSIIGKISEPRVAALLQKAHKRLLKCSSKKYWEDAITEYQDNQYNNVKLYVIEESDNGYCLKRNTQSIPIPDRAEAYINEIRAAPKASKTRFALKGEYKYIVKIPAGTAVEKTVRINSDISPDSKKSPQKSEREPVLVSVEELLNSAEEMKVICNDDICYDVLSKNGVLRADDNRLISVDKLEISQTTNIVGMVGSGKSTLIKALTFHLSKQGKRIVLIVDTADEALRFSRYFIRLGVSVSPLVGRSERMTYLSRVTEKGALFADDYYSKYLCGACLIEGKSDDREPSAMYGDEPCYSLKKGSAVYTCPFFNICPVTAMQREALTASVVVTTAQGLACAKVGADKRLFLEHVIEQADLVIFDECDRVQSVFDKLFTPETEFSKFIQENSEECNRDMKKSSEQRLNDINDSYFMELLHRSPTISDIVQKAVTSENGSWSKMLEHTFSSGTLLDQLKADGLPENVFKALEQAMHKPMLSEYSDLFSMACRSLRDNDFERRLRTVLDELGYKNYSREMFSHIKLYLIICGFDSYTREVDEQHSIYASENSDKELYNFLSGRFTQQKKLLPASVMGNLFGMKYDKKRGLVLYRQFACGRALLTLLPWLSIADDGKPLGTNVLLLSGSSWAKGCLEYHVNVPVKYILESEKWKSDFLSRSEIRELGITERVSGSTTESRPEHLSTVISKSMDTIRAELERDGCILVIVNSYSEAENAQKYLCNCIKEYKLNYKVVRMVKDMSEKTDICIPRGMLPDFDKYDAKILIAPAKAIERGYNIVDANGHSTFSSLFMMVRPLGNPDDISQKCAKLNGIIDADFLQRKSKNELEKAASIRKESAIKWHMFEGSTYGLSQLPDELMTDVTAGLFVMILQIFGRLARITDPNKEPPRIYFADGSFRASENSKKSYDCLKEIANYLQDLMNDEQHGAIASALYQPFYTAFLKGVKNNEDENKNPDYTDSFYSEDECYC